MTGEVTGRTVVFGIPTYNHVTRAVDAIGSLLAQTVDDLRIVVCDDQSTDGTFEALQDLARQDDRLHVFRNETRLGYIANAQMCVSRARELFPEAKFFAWGSDHDYWHPLWIERLLPVMLEDERVQLVWPQVVTVDGEDEIKSIRPFHTETRPGADRANMLSHIWEVMNAGNMIYGLFRMDFIVLSGGLRRVLLPDAMLIAKAALLGDIRQVRETLWLRRYPGIASLDRQIKASFHDKKEAAYHQRVPWYWVHYRHFLAFAQEAERQGRTLPMPPRKAARAYIAARMRRMTKKRVTKSGLKRLRNIGVLRRVARVVVPTPVKNWLR